jgi:hypothetical protein
VPQQPWLRPRLVLTYAVVAAGLVTAIWLPTRNDNADAGERDRNRDGRRDRDRSQSAFADEFGGGRGSTVDPERWVLREGQAGNGVQLRMSTRNARLDGDGNLQIVLRDEDDLTSARLETKSTLRASSGHVAARIRTPEGDDLRARFQLVGAGPDGGGRVDVLTRPEAGEFHTYALDWTPDTAVLSVDGTEVDRVQRRELFSDRPFRLALSLTADDDEIDAELPARMVVDSVDFATAGATPPPSTSPTPPASTSPPATPPATTPPATTPPATTEPPTEAPTSPPATTSPPPPPATSAPVSKKWAPFTDYVAGQLVTFKGVEYQVQQTHTSLPGWEPTALPELFKKI